MAEDQQPDTIPPSESVQQGGVSVGENAQITVGSGDIMAGNKTVAGRDVFQAGAGATFNIINLDPASLTAAGKGLAALGDLMRFDEVSRAVTVFQNDFQHARGELDKVRDYKKLHDGLHTLQYQCYNGIVEAAPDFPDNYRAVEKLSTYHITFEGLVEDMRKIASQPSMAGQDTSWIEKLARAREALSSVIENPDKEKLNQVTWQLKRVLGHEPSKINICLVEAARDLDLPALIQALTQLRDGLPAAGLDAEKVKQFEASVEGLSQIDKSLSSRVFQHDRWQKIELDLQQVEDSLELDLTNLEMVWPDLKDGVGQLLGDGGEEWAGGLKADGDKLDQARADKNTNKIKQHFRNFRSRAGRRFYWVDEDLKELCEQLREVGTPLASVLRMIE